MVGKCSTTELHSQLHGTSNNCEGHLRKSSSQSSTPMLQEHLFGQPGVSALPSIPGLQFPSIQTAQEQRPLRSLPTSSALKPNSHSPFPEPTQLCPDLWASTRPHPFQHLTLPGAEHPLVISVSVPALNPAACYQSVSVLLHNFSF